jgi:transposase
MANQLGMALIDSIFTLHQRGWSQRRIARELGIDRETVAHHLRQGPPGSKPANAPLGSAAEGGESKPANAPLGSEREPADSKPANAPLGSEPGSSTRDGEPPPRRGVGRPSDCESYRALILAWLEQGLSAQRIYQDLVGEHGFGGSYYSVRRFVGRLQAKGGLPVRRMECGPGEEVQVDFGSGAPIVSAEGKRRRPHVFRIVLSHSRKGYSEVVPRQTTEAFLRCLENAFWHFGGVPQRIVLDNLRAAVTQADWFDPELNPKVRSFAAHYSTVFLPTKPRTPQHKGKIERGIGYVKGNALKGRTFPSLQEQNQLVSRDAHVEVERAYYSVPPEYLGRRVWARWDGRTVRIFNHRFEQIALHARHEPGRFSTQPGHIADEKISGVERGAAWILGRIRRIGPCSTRWAEAMLQARGIEGVRVLQGLLSLAKRYRFKQLEHACDIAHSYGAFRLRTIRQLIDRDVPKQQEFDFMEDHPLIRPLAEYQQFVHDTVDPGVTS